MLSCEDCGREAAGSAKGWVAVRPETDRGVEVLTYPSPELMKGDGGPTCLTRPLLRG